MKIIRSIISSVAEGVIKRFTGAGRPYETFTDREFFQQYGFSSRPLSGAEGLVVIDGGIIYLIASDDRRYRIQLQDGEVVLYSDEGDKIHLKRNKEIYVKSGNKVIVEAVNLIDMNGGTGNTKGVVQGDCICHYTGLPHGDISINVKASK